MKYNIYINQKAFADHFPKIDLLGTCIYDILKSYCSASNSKLKKDFIDGKEYTRVSSDYSLKYRFLYFLY